MSEPLLPLNVELAAAIAALRAKRYYRAANRLERMSQNILKPKRKTPKARTVKVKLVGGSGKRVPIRVSQNLVDQAQEKP